MARSIKTVGEDGSARTVTFVTDAMCSAEEPELISATPISAVEMDMLEESFDEKITSATNKAIDIEGGVKDVASEEPSTSTPRQNRRHLAISPTSWAEVQREAPALQPCVSPSSVTAMSSLTARLEVDSANNVLKDADARNAAGSVNESDRVGTADIKSEISFEPTSIPTPESEPGGSDSVLAQPQEVLGAAYRAALRADGAARIRELHALGHNMNMTVDARTPLQAAAWLGHAEVSRDCVLSPFFLKCEAVLAGLVLPGTFLTAPAFFFLCFIFYLHAFLVIIFYFYEPTGHHSTPPMRRLLRKARPARLCRFALCFGSGQPGSSHCTLRSWG
jgi:hypothetical protein